VRGRLLPGCRNTGSVSARSAISAYQRACKPRVTKSRALICSFHGEVGIDPDATLAALAKSCSRSRARADSFGDKFAKLERLSTNSVTLSVRQALERSGGDGAARSPLAVERKDLRKRIADTPKRSVERRAIFSSSTRIAAAPVLVRPFWVLGAPLRK